MNMKFKEFYDEVYLTTLYFCWDCSYKEHKNIISKKKKLIVHWQKPTEHLCAETYKLVEENKHPIYVIWIESKKDFHTLSHEVTHIVFKVLSDRGVTVGVENQESFAYYHDFWLRKLWIVMGKKKEVAMPHKTGGKYTSKPGHKKPVKKSTKKK